MRFFLFLYFSICSFFVFSQNKIETQFLDSISLQADRFIGKDSFNNYYSVKENNFIKTALNKNWEYKNVALGKLTSVDILNPLQIVLFYKEYNTIVIVDNQLSEIQRINGNDYNLVFEACRLSIQNKLWFFDMLSLKIGMFNLEDNLYSFISTPLNETIQNYNSNYNRFYWVDNQNENYSISFFGKVKSLGKIPNYDTIQFISDTIFVYKTGNELFYVTRETNKSYQIRIDEKSFLNFFINGEILSIFTNNKVINYKINLP